MSIGKGMVEKIVRVLAAASWVDAAFIMGSAARGTSRADSDFDLAILPVNTAAFTAFDRVSLTVQIEELVGCPVDIGILDHKNLVYAKEAYLTGRNIYCREPFRCGLFGATALGLYAELREARKEVEDAYQTG